MDRDASIFAFPERSESCQRFLLPYGILLSITFTLYSAALYFNFIWDDFYYINRDFRIQSLSWPYFSSVWSHTYLGHYAPVHNTFLALLFHFLGFQPLGYHLGQLLLHAACVSLVYLVLKKLESGRVALLASVLFAVHPTNIETVAWISETKSTLAFFFFLLSFRFYIRLREKDRWWDAVLVGLFLILSILSKINTVVAPAIFLLFDYREGILLQRSRWRSLGGYFLISAVFTAVHLASFHSSAERLESSYIGGFAAHVQNLPFLLWFYVRMAAVPYPLTAAQLIRTYNRFDWVVGAAWIALLASLWLLSRSNRRIQFWGLWFLVFLAPVLQIVPNTIWVADRYLYIPLMGAAVLCSQWFFSIADRLASAWRRMAWDLAMLAVIAVLAWETHHHLPIWRDDVTLWEATIQTCMPSGYCHASFGQALMAAGQLQRGGDEIVRAVQLEPSPINLLYLGDALHTSARNYPEAIRMYRLALKAADDPRTRTDRSLVIALYAKLARAYIRSGMLDEAADALRSARNLDRTDVLVLVIDGMLKWKQGKIGEARRELAPVLYVANQTSRAEEFINFYWGDRAEVSRFMADLRASGSSNRPSGS
jgi:protein O-mannosyl-transferase